MFARIFRGREPSLYRYCTDANRYLTFRIDPKLADPILDLYFGVSRVASSWRPRPIEELSNATRKSSDFPTLNNLGDFPICSARAWKALEPLIASACEALPVIHPSGQPYYLVNVLDMVDCIDESKSVLVRNAVTGRVSRIFKYAIKHKMIQGRHIFKTPLKSGAELFIDDEFKKIVEANRLDGLLFEPLPLKED